MRIIKKLKWVFLAILIGVIGALLNENFIHYYTPKAVFYSILILGIGSTLITFLVKPTRRYKVHWFLLSLALGLILIPYFGLVIGYSDIFAKDQAGIQAQEVRFKIVKIEFRKEDTGVWETNIADRSVVLHPGENWAWVGRQEIATPVGYDRQRGVSEIETDVIWDQNIISQEHPDWQVPTPENNPEVIKSEDLGGGRYLITFFDRPEFDQPLPKFEEVSGGKELPSIPFSVYPDVGWEVIIAEDGRIEDTALHVLFPEPFGEFRIPIGTPEGTIE
jgi:hypothetical protein